MRAKVCGGRPGGDLGEEAGATGGSSAGEHRTLTDPLCPARASLGPTRAPIHDTHDCRPPLRPSRQRVPPSTRRSARPRRFPTRAPRPLLLRVPGTAAAMAFSASTSRLAAPAVSRRTAPCMAAGPSSVSWRGPTPQRSRTTSTPRDSARPPARETGALDRPPRPTPAEARDRAAPPGPGPHRGRRRVGAPGPGRPRPRPRPGRGRRQGPRPHRAVHAPPPPAPEPRPGRQEPRVSAAPAPPCRPRPPLEWAGR